MITVKHPSTRPSPMTPAIVRLLREWGEVVDQLQPDENVTDLGLLSPRHDLCVLRSGSDLALSVAGALHAQGARIVNPYPTAVACRAKVVATRVPQAAGIPVPATWATTRPHQLAALVGLAALYGGEVSGGRAERQRLLARYARHAWSTEERRGFARHV
jgi:glutathione synthase/RimK-type ligase-like ATP-grasp enzyme